MQELKTAFANSILSEVKELAISCLLQAENFAFSRAETSVQAMHDLIDKKSLEQKAASDDELNDLYLLHLYADLILSHIAFWQNILDGKFSASWGKLQDILDILRILKRFSSINLDQSEYRALELEKLYPYRIFFSIGAVAEKYECSICQLDMHSDDCPHIKGQLYRGQMARAIARKITEVDHLAMVDHPEDKRCVVVYPDDGEEFKLVRHLATLVSTRKLSILGFRRVEFSKIMRQNPDFQKISRNAPCFCKSGKKFKFCCISKKYIEGDHVDIVGHPPLKGRADL